MSTVREYARRNSRARVRTTIWERPRTEPPLKKLTDQGGSTTLAARDVGASEASQWVEPFLSANQAGLKRLSVVADVLSHRGQTVVELTAGDRLGAVPLASPVTRKTAAGLLVSPKYGWWSVGQVFSNIGFRVEPEVGGSALVPGSAREVPPWVLAGPVIARIAAALEHLTRTFREVEEIRAVPRGRPDWNQYVSRSLPTGRWNSFLCKYSDLVTDPELIGSIRWTLHRIAQDLEAVSTVGVTSHLLLKIQELLRKVGFGPALRPKATEMVIPLASDWMSLLLEAVAWIRDERGLGGARSLDGLSWSLGVGQIWEAWVESFLATLALRLGARLSSARLGSTRRPLAWQGLTRSLGHLAPDFMLELPTRVVWVDAKYKDHLERLRRNRIDGMSDSVRESHRADMHQALAYALLADLPQVDTILLYPHWQGTKESEFATADLPSAGRKRVRVVLGSIPFGFEGPAEREATLASWENLLRATA